MANSSSGHKDRPLWLCKSAPGSMQKMLTCWLLWQVRCKHAFRANPLTIFRHAPFSFSRSPTARDVHPFSQARTLLALNIDNVCVTATSAADTIFFDLVPVFPVLVLFYSLLLIQGCHFKVRSARQLSGWSIGRTMLNSGVPVADVTEVMDILDSQKRTSSERMNWCVTPLEHIVSDCQTALSVARGGPLDITRSIQKPPLRSIISKKSLYSLLLNQLSLAISKFDQKWHMLYFSPSIS